MPEVLSLDAWRARLESRGHRVSEEGTATGLRLWPDPDMIVTVAVEPDVTLKPLYRQRFFLCDPEPEQVFRVTGCLEQYQTRWTELLSQQPPSYWKDFLAGPGSWLLSRLTRFRQIVAWSGHGLPWDLLDCPTHRQGGMEVPALAAPFFTATDGPEACQPRVLPVDDEGFADAVAACMLFASVGDRDCYLADADGNEVYLAHHHEKVEFLIRDATVRENLVRELEEASWLLADASGYASGDEDDEGDDEIAAP